MHACTEIHLHGNMLNFGIGNAALILLEVLPAMHQVSANPSSVVCVGGPIAHPASSRLLHSDASPSASLLLLWWPVELLK